MKSLIKLPILIFICILLAGTLLAKETGEISGKVTDDEGTALPGVSITATSPRLQGKRSVISGNDGSFRLPLLPIGIYTLTFELQGFATVIQENVGVKLGMVTSINVLMKVATIEEQLTVIAEAPLIDKTKSDTSFYVGTKELANAPIQARTIQEIIHYTPGVTGVRNDTNEGVGGGGTSFGPGSFRGEGGTGNNWLVDGLSNRGNLSHESGVRVNYDAWEEVQIISDGFSPELGQAYGGIINIVTKSGGNEFHGELGALVLDQRLRAGRKDQIAVAVEPDTSTFNYFGNLGGPIFKDKLWFFISNNYWHTADDMEPGSIGWLNIPEGKKRTNTNNVFAKLTYALAQNHTISFSGTYDKFLNQTGGFGVPERYEKQDYKNYAYRLNYKGILGPNTLFEVAVGRSSSSYSIEPLSGDTKSPAVQYLDIGQYTNNLGTVFSSADRRTDFTSRFTQYLNTEKFGNHELGAGFLYYYLYRDQLTDYNGSDFDLWPGNGFDSGTYLTFLKPGIPYQIWEFAPQAYYNDSKGFGVYIKDKIAFGRFTVLLGVRSETQKIYNDVGEEILNWGLDKFISPRFSLAWDITGDGVNVFKLGVGQFTDTMLFDLLAFFNKQGGSRFRNYAWIGPTPTDLTDPQIKDPSNWQFVFQQGMIGEGEPLLFFKDDVHPDKSTKIVVEFDRRLGPYWALKLRGIYTNHPNMLEDLAYFTYDDWFYRVENWEEKKRDYKGIEIEVNGRVAEKFFLNASYVWSQAKGTTPGAFEQIGGWFNIRAYNTVGIFGDHMSGPDDSPLSWLGDITVGMGGKEYGDEGWYGFLPYSVDHVVKVLGIYLAPYDFIVTAGFELYSGYHWSIWGLQPAYGVYGTFPKGRGTEKLPTHTYVDLSIQKDLVLPAGVTLGLRLNVTNLFNSQKPLSYMNGEGQLLFGEVYGRQFPRWVQFQVLLRF